jgi:hypothetical protein
VRLALLSLYIRLLYEEQHGVVVDNPHILNPCAALSHCWSSSPLILFRIRLPPIIAWKCFILSSCVISTNRDSPAASTVLCAVCTTGELWIEGRVMIVGTLSDATMNCAAYGLRPARRRNVSHYIFVSMSTCKREVTSHRRFRRKQLDIMHIDTNMREPVFPHILHSSSRELLLASRNVLNNNTAL